MICKALLGNAIVLFLTFNLTHSSNSTFKGSWKPFPLSKTNRFQSNAFIHTLFRHYDPYTQMIFWWSILIKTLEADELLSGFVNSVELLHTAQSPKLAASLVDRHPHLCKQPIYSIQFTPVCIKPISIHLYEKPIHITQYTVYITYTVYSLHVCIKPISIHSTQYLFVCKDKLHYTQ